MPAIAQKNTKSGRVSTINNTSAGGGFISRIPPAVIGIACGAFLGLSAPGIGLWFGAWFGLAPLLLLASASTSIWRAAWRGFLFGFGYNFVYLNWFLGLQPLDWLGFNAWQGALLATAAWVYHATHQALLVGIFAACMKLTPMHGGFFPEKIKGQWRLPALLVVPILWILCVNKLGNAHVLLGAPWTMLEYSQYKQVAIIQICSIIGGIGLNYLIVLVNTAIAALLGIFLFKKLDLSISASKRMTALGQLMVCALLISSTVFYGFWQLSKARESSPIQASVLQGNINIDMQKAGHRFTLHDLTAHYTKLLNSAPAGLSIWPESALPCYLSREPALLEHLSSIAEGKHLDMIIGAMDKDERNRPYNSAYGINSSGKLAANIYHKRYLVPFGEYTPAPARLLPEWILRLTNTPAGSGFESGTDAAVLRLNCGQVGPLICFETLSPELVAASVRKGARLLVNVGDPAWFHDSICGEQMIAFSVLRAVESDRFFIFAANTGPSAIIDPAGRITHRSVSGKECVLVGKVGFLSDVTPFSQWFVF
jgi:apolipoprotein N-acyltransferase